MVATTQPLFQENDTTDQTAQTLRQLFQKFVKSRTGVLTPSDLLVTQRAAGANMSVDVSTGFSTAVGTEGSNPGSYFHSLQASQNLAISAAHATLARRDLVITRVRDAFYSGANNDGECIVVTGTPAASPADPDLVALGYKSYVTLARVQVNAAATSITNANITRLAAHAPVNGPIVCTSTTRPTTNVSQGDMIYETDTDLLAICKSIGPIVWRYIAEQGAPWTSYTPALQAVFPGNSPGYLFGRYKRLGKLVVVEAGFRFGPNGVLAASPNIGIGLPSNARFAGGATDVTEYLFGSRKFSPINGQNWAGIGAVWNGGAHNMVINFATGGSSGWTVGIPNTWFAGSPGDGMTMFGVYEED